MQEQRKDVNEVQLPFMLINLHLRHAFNITTHLFLSPSNFVDNSYIPTHLCDPQMLDIIPQKTIATICQTRRSNRGGLMQENESKRTRRRRGVKRILSEMGIISERCCCKALFIPIQVELGLQGTLFWRTGTQLSVISFHQTETKMDQEL